MTALFGSKYFGFILSAYGITAVALIALTVWIFLTHARRNQQIAMLEEAGLKRASRHNG